MQYETVSKIFSLHETSDMRSEIRALKSVILDLFCEVEALRATVIKLAEKSKEPGMESEYSKCYSDTMLFSYHPFFLEKQELPILSKFYPSSEGSGAEDRYVHRELLFLERLGYGKEELVSIANKITELQEYS